MFPKAAPITARVLAATTVQGVSYKPNDLISFPGDIAKDLDSSGVIDDSKDAVEYCKKVLGKKPVEHVAVKANSSKE